MTLRSGYRDSSDLIAMPLVLMMQMTFYDMVHVLAVRNRFVSAARLMSVLLIMRTARMARRTIRRIRSALCQGMFIHVSRVDVVKMPVVQIVDVTVVLYRGVTA